MMVAVTAATLFVVGVQWSAAAWRVYHCHLKSHLKATAFVCRKSSGTSVSAKSVRRSLLACSGVSILQLSDFLAVMQLVTWLTDMADVGEESATSAAGTARNA